MPPVSMTLSTGTLQRSNTYWQARLWRRCWLRYVKSGAADVECYKHRAACAIAALRICAARRKWTQAATRTNSE